MTWERAIHFAGPLALFLISLRPLLRRRGHFIVDRKTAWLCLFAGLVWPLSVILRIASGEHLERRFEVLDAASLFFGGILFVYGFWVLRRVRFYIHTNGDAWADPYRRPERLRNRSSSDRKP